MKNALIIGTGSIANAHAKALATIDGVRVSAVCDVDEERARAFAVAHSFDAEVYTTIPAAFDGAKPDYVILLAPRNVRREVVELCIKRNTPLFVEKPPAATVAEAEDIARLIGDAGLLHSVALMSRYNESLNHVLGLIGDEQLSLITVDLHAPLATHPDFDRTPQYYRREWGGPGVDNGIHYVDVSRYITKSEVRNVRAVGRNQMLERSAAVDVVDSAVWWLEMESGVLVTTAMTWCAREWRCRIGLVTDKSDLVVDMFKNTVHGELAGEAFEFEGGPDAQGYEAENRAFLEAVETGSMAPVRSTYADAVESYRVTEEINRQLYVSGGTP